MTEFKKTKPDDAQFLWLSEHGSMTRRIIAAGLGTLKVNVICCEHQIPVMEEMIFLDLPPHKSTYVREVMMYVDNASLMYGRTIIPDAALNSGGGQLKLLGETPLGKVLFENSNSSRLFIEIAKISKAHHLYPDFIEQKSYTHLWARRSLFHFQKSPILVQEVFLPDCPFRMPE